LAELSSATAIVRRNVPGSTDTAALPLTTLFALKLDHFSGVQEFAGHQMLISFTCQ
jgi:hypothetical protein